MFNGEEWKKLFSGLGIGLLVGAGIDVLLFIYELCAESINCFMDCLCSGEVAPEIKDDNVFLYVILIATGIGVMIGFFSALVARSERIDAEKAAWSAEAHNQRIKWAGEIKQKALSVCKKCESYSENYIDVVSVDYLADEQMGDIITEVQKISELLGKVDYMVEDVMEKGGDLS